jgi:flagellin-like protein
MNNFKKFMKNSKAISPIFATLILIAIAVIAGVVVYMFTSGTLATMTSGGTAAQEKVAIQGVDKAGTVYAQNMGNSVVSIVTVVVKDTSGNTVSSTNLATAVPLPAGVVTPVTFTPPATSGAYTVTLISKAAGSFVSTSFVI